MINGRRGAFVMASSGDPKTGGGLVAYLLHKNHGFRSVIVGCRADETSYPTKLLRGVEFDFLSEDTPDARTNYIYEHAAEIDLLILCDAEPANMSPVEHYKTIRPDGKIFLAADTDIASADRLPHENPRYQKFLSSCDVVAANCRAVQKYLATKWNVPVDLIRNGWYDYGVNFNKLFAHKENVILSVVDSQSRILLDAFAKISDDLHTWKLRLVGDVDEDFNSYVEEFFAARPELKKRINFSGRIKDDAALTTELKRAKIFCLTSFADTTAAVEALFCGDAMICPIGDAADDLTDSGNCGETFSDVDGLAKVLGEICPDDGLILGGGQYAFEYARDQFDMNKIVARLNYLLYGGDGT